MIGIPSIRGVPCAASCSSHLVKSTVPGRESTSRLREADAGTLCHVGCRRECVWRVGWQPEDERAEDVDAVPPKHCSRCTSASPAWLKFLNTALRPSGVTDSTLGLAVQHSSKVVAAWAGEYAASVNERMPLLMALCPGGLCLRGVEGGECATAESLRADSMQRIENAFQDGAFGGNYGGSQCLRGPREQEARPSSARASELPLQVVPVVSCLLFRLGLMRIRIPVLAAS